MAATAVLQPPQPHPHPHPDTRANMNPFRSRRRKRSPTGLAATHICGNRVPDRKDPVPAFYVKNNNNNHLVMGQVKILKRGEPLPEKKAETTPSADKLGFSEELILCSTDRLGPDPQMVHKQIRASDFYAGSGPIVASPDPSSLPFPSLLTAKKEEKKSDAAATMDLLRLLRLDLP